MEKPIDLQECREYMAERLAEDYTSLNMLGELFASTCPDYGVTFQFQGDAVTAYISHADGTVISKIGASGLSDYALRPIASWLLGRIWRSEYAVQVPDMPDWHIVRASGRNRLIFILHDRRVVGLMDYHLDRIAPNAMMYSVAFAYTNEFGHLCAAGGWLSHRDGMPFTWFRERVALALAQVTK